LRFNANSATAITLAGTNVVTSGGILVTSAAGASSIGGGTISGASGKDLIVIQNSASDLSISSKIADNTSATGLTKSGAGRLNLSGANTYTGATTLNGGMIKLDSASALPGGIGATGGTSNLNFKGGVIGLTDAS